MSKSKRKHRSAPAKTASAARGSVPGAIAPPASAPCMTEAEAEALSAAPWVSEAEALLRGPAPVRVPDPDAPPWASEATAPIAAPAESRPEEPGIVSGATDDTEAGAPDKNGDEAPATRVAYDEMITDAPAQAKAEPPCDWLFAGDDDDGVTRPSASESERRVLLRVVPDDVFCIRLRPDGGVLVTDARSQPGPGEHESIGVAAASEGQLVDAEHGLKNELARRAGELMDGFHRSGEVQTLEIQACRDGHVNYYEIRAAGCAAGEVLAVVHNGQTTFREIGASNGGGGELVALVRDVTARREAEASMARTEEEVTRLNEVLKSEASVHAEDEEIMESAFRKLGRLLEDTIGALQMIVQMKDPPTARHQARVCKLACAIGREMGLEKSQVDTIGLAALLHDLGKILIPSDMLNKPGRLTEKELSAIRNSAETEYQILKTIDLFCPIADIVHQHHERLDGSGYPLGLKGSDILLEARVIAVADVVEAMVSERPYRPALSLGAALKEIQVNKGRLYDPRVVEACSHLFMNGSFAIDGLEEDAAQEGAYSGA